MNRVSLKLYRNKIKWTELVQNFTGIKQNELGYSKTLQEQNKKNWDSPNLCMIETKRTGFVQNFTETIQNELD